MQITIKCKQTKFSLIRIVSDLLFKPESDEKVVDVAVTQEQSFIKKQLGVYSEDDAPMKQERAEKTLEPWEIEMPKRGPSWVPSRSEPAGVPISKRVFTAEELEEVSCIKVEAVVQ